LKAAAAGRRIGQQHPQDPARPRTPHRTNLRRSRRTRSATHPRPHRRHLAQRQNRPVDPAITDRIRSLTPWNNNWSIRSGRRWRPSAPARRRRRPRH
jgi:hypothetical protein